MDRADRTSFSTRSPVHLQQIRDCRAHSDRVQFAGLPVVVSWIRVAPEPRAYDRLPVPSLSLYALRAPLEPNIAWQQDADTLLVAVVVKAVGQSYSNRPRTKGNPLMQPRLRDAGDALPEVETPLSRPFDADRMSKKPLGALRRYMSNSLFQ